MKLRIITWSAIVIFGILLYFDVLNLYESIFVLAIQSILIVVNVYWFFKSDDDASFESDDILDC